MRYSTAPAGPRPSADSTTNQKNTPNTWRCAASSECSITWRSSSVRGSSLASRWRHCASRRARLVLVAALERVADVGEVVAELAKAERQVQHQHVERERRAARASRPAHRCTSAASGAGATDRDEPDDPGVVRAPGVEVAAGPAHPRDQAVVHPVVARQRLASARSAARTGRRRSSSCGDDSERALRSAVAASGRATAHVSARSGTGCAASPRWRPR